ncbi:hypothetical protein [Deinococcus sp.]|uniref:hypothetical protein n=1 Tax=Deinococcus sp. TaxID=47478 RepID=UPI0028699036|nr:hypothetical protein [Deinococcus sp.]
MTPSAQLFTLATLRPAFLGTAAGQELAFIPAKGAPSGGLAHGGARDYGQRRVVRVRGNFVFDAADFTVDCDVDGALTRDGAGALCWHLDATARPIAVVSALEGQVE